MQSQTRAEHTKLNITIQPRPALKPKQSYLHRVSKKTIKIIFVITTSNFNQIQQFLAQIWQIV